MNFFFSKSDQDAPQEIDEKEGKEELVFGPSISFAGQPARWTGDGYSYADQIGIEARVTFESLAGDRVTSYLYIINDGTTSVYYDWKVGNQCTDKGKQCTDKRNQYTDKGNQCTDKGNQCTYKGNQVH